MWKLFKFFFTIVLILLITLVIYALIFEVIPLTETAVMRVPIEHD